MGSTNERMRLFGRAHYEYDLCISIQNKRRNNDDSAFLVACDEDPYQYKDAVLPI